MKRITTIAWLGLCIPVISTPILCLTAPAAASAQTVFASSQSATLPTASPSDAGDILVEVSHRFGHLSGGASDLWGLDGFVLNRLGLAFAPHDDLTVGILRSNSLDNTEFNVRFSGLGFDAPTGPIEFATQAGVAWNLQVDTAGGHVGHQHVILLADKAGTADNPGTGDNAGAANRSRDETAEANEMQAYAQVIANAMIAGRVALGVVPTFLWNPRIQDDDPVSTFSVGVNGQLYLDRTWSVFGEWIFSQPRVDQEYDSGSFGVEIRTRGHFFKLLVTNQHQMNPTQTLAGAAEDFLDPDSWRIGFNIQRRLRF